MRTPYKCPVCEGRGLVHAQFYNFNSGSTSCPTLPEMCRSCNGSGVLWQEEPSSFELMKCPLCGGTMEKSGINELTCSKCFYSLGNI